MTADEIITEALRIAGAIGPGPPSTASISFEYDCLNRMLDRWGCSIQPQFRNIPPGYRDAIVYNLAVELAQAYGIMPSHQLQTEAFEALKHWKASQGAPSYLEYKGPNPPIVINPGSWEAAAREYSAFYEATSQPIPISPAMEQALAMMNPEMGTAIAYYLGKHPEECAKILEATIGVTCEKDWQAAERIAVSSFGEIYLRIGEVERTKMEAVLLLLEAKAYYLERLEALRAA
jgi:hypothetical protein